MTTTYDQAGHRMTNACGRCGHRMSSHAADGCRMCQFHGAASPPVSTPCVAR